MDEKKNDRGKKGSRKQIPNDHDIFDDLADLEKLSEMASEIQYETEPSSNGNDDSFKKCDVCGGELINGECLSCTKREEVERELFEPEDEDFEEDDYTAWRSELKSKGELNLFGIFCIVVASIYVIYISFPEVISVLTGEFVLEQFVLFFILFVMGLGALFGGFVMARHAHLKRRSIQDWSLHFPRWAI
jgi:hypothetical protein